MHAAWCQHTSGWPHTARTRNMVTRIKGSSKRPRAASCRGTSQQERWCKNITRSLKSSSVQKHGVSGIPCTTQAHAQGASSARPRSSATRAVRADARSRRSVADEPKAPVNGLAADAASAAVALSQARAAAGSRASQTAALTRLRRRLPAARASLCPPRRPACAWSQLTRGTRTHTRYTQ